MFPPCTLSSRKEHCETDRHIANVAFAEQLMGPFYQGADALLTQSQARRQISRPEGVHHHAAEGAKFASCFTLGLPLQTRRLRPNPEVQVALADVIITIGCRVDFRLRINGGEGESEGVGDRFQNFKGLYKEPLIPNLNYVSSTAVTKGFSRLGDHSLLFEARGL